MANPYEFLLKKGIKKIHQPKKRYNLTVQELAEFLKEFAIEYYQDELREKFHQGENESNVI